MSIHSEHPRQSQASQDGAMNLLQSWKCHKVVKAAKVINVYFGYDLPAGFSLLKDWTPPPPSDSVQTPSLVSIYFEGDVELLKGLEVEYAWYLKHKPDIGGYYVLYEDGYASYSPASAFEAGYALQKDVPQATALESVIEALIPKCRGNRKLAIVFAGLRQLPGYSPETETELLEDMGYDDLVEATLEQLLPYFQPKAPATLA